jgi:hypothetical protein
LVPTIEGTSRGQYEKREWLVSTLLIATSWEQTALSEIDRSKAPVCEEAMSDILRRKRLGRTALLGSVLLALVCMALFGAARFFVA